VTPKVREIIGAAESQARTLLVTDKEEGRKGW